MREIIFNSICLLVIFGCSTNQGMQKNAYKFKEDISLVTSKFNGIASDIDSVDTKPRLNVCQDSDLDQFELNECAEHEMLKFIYQNLKYPLLARNNGIQGTVILGMIITEDGDIRNVFIIKTIGYHADHAAIDVLAQLDKNYQFTPATINGNNVACKYSLPIHYKIH